MTRAFKWLNRASTPVACFTRRNSSRLVRSEERDILRTKITGLLLIKFFYLRKTRGDEHSNILVHFGLCHILLFHPHQHPPFPPHFSRTRSIPQLSFLELPGFIGLCSVLWGPMAVRMAVWEIRCEMACGADRGDLKKEQWRP